jgi:hypothetical protein
MFCGLKVVKFVRANSVLNPRAKELNQQLTKTLFIMVCEIICLHISVNIVYFISKAFYPLSAFLSLMIVSFLIVAMNIVAKEMLARITMSVLFLILLVANWLPVGNPIVSIWINTPYRDAVKKFFANLFKRNTNSISPAIPHINQ